MWICSGSFDASPTQLASRQSARPPDAPVVAGAAVVAPAGETPTAAVYEVSASIPPVERCVALPRAP